MADSIYLKKLNYANILKENYTLYVGPTKSPDVVLGCGFDMNDVNNPRATGIFKVVNNNNETALSPLPLNIFYSLLNDRDANGVTKLNVYHYNANSSGGYSFYVDTAISHNQMAYNCVKKAIREWQCATGINFTIIGDTFGVQQNTNDGISIIKYGNINTIAKAYPVSASCGTPYFRFIYECDIIINNSTTYNWWYDTTGLISLPPNRADFYYTILHEIGHAAGLLHVNDPNAIMYFASPYSGSTGIPASQRLTDLKHDGSAILGGRRQVSISALSSNLGGCGVNEMIPLQTCIGYTSITELYNSEHIKTQVYPVPFSDNLTVESEYPISEIILYNSIGAVVEDITYNSKNKIIPIELSHNNLSVGVYFLLIKTINGVSYKRLIHE